MSSSDEAPDRAQEDEQPAPEDAPEEAVWTPPEQSDQAPGEETVQVNDQYTGGAPPPDDEAPGDDDQHPTGG